MDPDRQRIQEDLRGLVSGEVRCDDIFLRLYASDASIYEIQPLGIVRPRNTADVVACLQYANENHIPVHARGAGTGLAGESLGAGLVIDFSRFMRRILRTDEETVRVQAGVVHQTLNNHLRADGRQFGPDPAMSDVTTMGSVIAIDASGSHRLRYGSARRHVKSLQIVMADGEVMEVGSHRLEPGQLDTNPRRHALTRHLANLISRNADLIAAAKPKSTVNRSGYRLDDVLTDERLDLAKMLVGSEGTLALVTEATLATQPLARHRGAVLLLFNSLEVAARAALQILPLDPSACDLMDRRHLSLARECDVRYELLIPPEAEAVLLVEQDGETEAEVRDRLTQVVACVRGKNPLAAGALVALDADDFELFWQLARKFTPTLYRMKGTTRPLPFIEDIAVAPEVLPEFLVRLQNTLKKHQVTASLFGHAGHGQLHIRPFLDLANADDVRKMEHLADDLYREVFDLGGTISGEHADGLSRTPFVARQFGPVVDVFREVKRIFDPHGILNPGKIVSLAPTRITDHLRPVAAPTSTATSIAEADSAAVSSVGKATTIDLQLNWQDEEMADAAVHCNGCGACRSQADDVRMCPIFRFAPREESSPRAKANLIRGVLTGGLDPETLTQDAFKAVVDLCVHCHQCRLECPASVDIPKLMAEARGAYVRANGLRPTDWVMARIDTVSRLGSRLSPLANWALANRQARWLIEKLLGIAQGRKLPRFAQRSFMQEAVRRRLTRRVRHNGLKVLYFVDTYANYHDPQLADAFVRVLEHNGVPVYVHPGQRHSAMSMISLGALDEARRVAESNIALLADAVRQGYTIVATEPSAVLCLTHEYLSLVDDVEDARLVADNSREACHFLWGLHGQGQLQLDFRPQSATVGYHVPCHVKALEIGAPGENLLRLIPGLTVIRIEKGCSGMAGTFGLKRENYRNSLRAGWGLISAVRDAPIHVGTTECSTCKMQMEQGTDKPTVHPIKLVALAYGLMPEIGTLIARRGQDLIVT